MISLLNVPCSVGSKVRSSLSSILWLVLLGVLLHPCRSLAANQDGNQGFLDALVQRSTLSSLLRLEGAITTHKGDLQKLEVTYEPKLKIELPYHLRFTTIVRLRADASDELEPGGPDQPEVAPVSRSLALNDHVTFALRECYLEGTIGRTLLRIGKQQIVWGKADGLKVLDVVNPQSFREFILEDFDRSRIPLSAVNAEVPIADVTLQLVWIPENTYHDLPTPNAAFAFTSPLLVPPSRPGVRVDLRDAERPNRFLLNSDVGACLSAFVGGWDLTLNYLYHYDDFPVLFRELSLTPSGPLATITPRYRRTHLVGGTFSNAFGKFVVRGELGFSFDRFFPTEDPTRANGVIKTNEFASVLGLDWSGIEDTFMSVQVFQSVLTERPPGVFRDQCEGVITALVRRNFLHDRLVAEVLLLQSLNRGDGLVRSKLRYELRSNVTVWGGTDVFYGDKNGLFGEFTRQTRVIFGLEWGF